MNNLRKIRRKKDITQYEFLKPVGIAQTTISQIENSYREPTLKTKIKIATVLGCDFREIFPE